MGLPDFFVLGAPKCGTSSLVDWLRQHPEVFLSSPKEPGFFNTDYSLPYRPVSRKAYEALFDGSSGYRAVGEATTGYLVSNEAVPAIMELIPSAKFVVCLRNPVDMVISLHGERLKAGHENIKRVEDAWAAQAARRHGERIPNLCPDGKLLLYDEFCSLGMQVARLLDRVPRERVLFLLLEDMIHNPLRCYARVCAFLGIDPNHEPDFRMINAGRVPRYLAIAQALRVIANVKRGLGINTSVGMAKLIRKWTYRHRPSDASSNEFRLELARYFYHDIAVLASLTERDLSHWQAQAYQ